MKYRIMSRGDPQVVNRKMQGEFVTNLIRQLKFKREDFKVIGSFGGFSGLIDLGNLAIAMNTDGVGTKTIIAEEAKVFGDKLSAGVFYWASGGLSAVLDNTPTYMNFLSAAMGKYSLNVADKTHVLKFVEVDDIYLKAISVAAVFFGAMTYIGNGPNFMVKSISERAGIVMPSFFNYIIRYSVIILLPIFTLIWLLFFTGRTIL